MKTCQDIPLNSEYTVILFYKYTRIEDPEAFRAWQKSLCEELGLTGRILIAHEGMNTTLEGTTENTQKYIAALRAQDGTSGTLADFHDVEIKTSVGTGKAFKNLKVKVRAEIVALALNRYGEEDVDPNETTGVHLKPEELKKMYENDEDFVVIDMRNDYEFKVGHFKNSINPPMENFRELPEALPKILAENPEMQNKKVITVCTGGIRCEKASGYLIKKGFTNVYQLDGGMHKYMEQFPGQDFKGGLFTFDDRVVMDFGKDREVIGRCDICLASTERFDNCVNDECHKHMIICHECAQTNPYHWCSIECKETGRTGTTRFKEMGVTGAVAQV